jgi:hypothetical protein
MTSVVPKKAKKPRALQAAEKLTSEGGGGFNPRIKPSESIPALAADGPFPSFSPTTPSFSAACLAPAAMLALRRTHARFLLNHGFHIAPQLTKMVKSSMFTTPFGLKQLVILTALHLPF